MPAVSPKQQRLMAQAYALKTRKKKKSDIKPEYREQISKLAKSMTKKQLRDFAKTKHSDMKENLIIKFENFNESQITINHKDQNLSKDMTEQDHVNSKKPNNSNLSSEDHLAEVPKTGNYKEPSNKKLSGEEFLSTDHKFINLKNFDQFTQKK